MTELDQSKEKTLRFGGDPFTSETELRGLLDAHHTAKAAAELATQTFKKDSTLLPETGGEAWKKLFEAARAFCTEALPDKTFPNLGSDAQCPLCQQPLNESADRLLRFEKFIQDETEKKTQARKKAYEDGYKFFTSQSLALGGLVTKSVDSM